ncbi:MAG TPA: ketopantoate reductase C-terminal domain-containing protein [Victivallales bacterium]|nr:ketopantoate reductase C-terminal domain-containing protein [Victivallales bacterium]
MNNSLKRKTICIYGSGAIGLDLGIKLIVGGHKVTFIARGSTLSSLKNSGIVYQTGKEERVITPDMYSCTEDCNSAGRQDYVFLTVNADSLLSVSDNLPSLFHDKTVVVSATNGIPPWFSYLQNSTIGRYLDASAPQTRFFRSVSPDRIIGAIIQRSIIKKGDNVIIHTSGTGYKLGELDHTVKSRTLALKELLEESGFTAGLSTDIHRDIWIKLLGNICVNPLSVITGKKIGDMIDDKQILQRMKLLVEETKNVGIKLGIIKSEDYIFQDFLSIVDSNFRDHETSMLQSFKKGKNLEVHRILQAPIMLAELKGVDIQIPNLKAMCREIQQKIQTAQAIL